MRKMLFWCTLCVLLTFSGTFALAKNPAPYVPTKGTSFQQVFSIIEKMPVDSLARIEFFKESEKNLGLNEAQLKEAIKSGRVRSEACGEDCKLESAGLQDGKSKYWRMVEENEITVFVYINGQWKPWFLVKCGNPVKDSQPPAPPVTTYQKRDCCWQTGQPIVLESAFIGGGTISIHNDLAIGTAPAPRFVSIFYPIACSGETFNAK